MKKPKKIKKGAIFFQAGFFGKNQRGFSFLEVILSVFVLVAGILAVTPLLGQGIRVINDSRDYVIASMLAQEGVELVQNIRDNNWADGDFSTKSFSVFPVASPEKCIVDKTGLFLCPGGGFGNKKLKINGQGFYVNSFGGGGGGLVDTRFAREVTISSQGEDKKVVAMVVWSRSSFPANLSDCIIASNCAYAETVLTGWGG